MFAGNNIGYFGPYEALLRDDMPGDHTAGCTAGIHSLGLEANGDIKGCPSLPSESYVGGNIRDHKLRDVWERSKALRFTRDRTVKVTVGRAPTPRGSTVSAGETATSSGGTTRWNSACPTP